MKRPNPLPTLFQAIAPQASAVSILARITSGVKREVAVPRAPDLEDGTGDQQALRQVLEHLKDQEASPPPPSHTLRSAVKRAVVPPPDWPRNSSQGG
jgi:hypothetical protein